MENLTHTVNELISRFNTLADRFTAMKVQVNQLEKERNALKEQVAQKSNEVAELEEKVKTLQLTKGRLSDEERTELKRKINEYVREIDKAIAQLND